MPGQNHKEHSPVLIARWEIIRFGGWSTTLSFALWFRKRSNWKSAPMLLAGWTKTVPAPAWRHAGRPERSFC